jgi:ubiquinone/menaquinone biosynthesis C-methylase UbiE
MHREHSHHHGAFADPAKAASKWNSPERDAWQHPEQIIVALELRGGETVADIGAGTGYMVAHLSKAVGEAGTIIAVDTEPAMIEYLSQRSETLRPATIEPHHASPDDPQLPDESMDAILILDTWHHIGRRTDYARKLYAALKPGGRLVIVETTIDAKIGPPEQMRVTPSQVQQELSCANLRAQIILETMPRHYLIAASKE